MEVRAVSHITGGGFYENVPRMMRPGLTARISLGSFPIPDVFGLIQQRGDIPVRDMYNTFNMGLGMLLAVPEEQRGRAMAILKEAGEDAYAVGSVARGDGGVELEP